jgi:hypothetical protein
MLAALGLIVVSYIFPILVGTLAATDIAYESWTDGTFTEVGGSVYFCLGVCREVCVCVRGGKLFVCLGVCREVCVCIGGGGGWLSFCVSVCVYLSFPSFWDV